MYILILFLAVLSLHFCLGFSLVMESRCYSLIAEHRLWSMGLQ